MRIKRVVIQGFKTFARKTEFIFDPGVTAIVGPNGSGKSNIVDAIRWCLGEQSFSLLRSKKTSDIIFSGSDQKARLGMAQVTVTLDNSQGQIPLDFEEVEITRRAYRDGNNEYLINGQRVRLQDITEALAQTGLGKRTYALIGQGLIDRVLSLAPEERRSLFEEAAGITGYQAKRNTTLRRLEATQQNLTRVQDIIAELSPRLGHLRRQAERAREREQIAADLRQLLRTWYGYRWHQALAELERQHGQVVALKQQVARRQQELEAVGRQIESLRTRQAALRNQLGDRHRESSILHRQAERVGRELAVAQERLRQVQARQEEAQRELVPLRLQQETLQGRIADLEGQLAQSRAHYEERRAQVEAVQREVARRQQEQAELEQQLAVARQTVNQLATRRANDQARIQQWEERQASLRQELAEQTEALAASRQAAQALQEHLQEAERLLAATQAEGTRVQQEMEQRQAEMAALRQALAEAQEVRVAADRTADRLQTRFELLQRLRNEGAGYASGVRAVLAAAQGPSPALTGVIGTVATAIHVPPHLDRAMETALGGAIQHVIVRRWGDAQRAIEYLKQSGQGRATFLPLDRLHVLPPIPAPRQPGVLGNAAELVSYSPDVEPAVQQLLNRVWVVEDLDTARQALDSITRGPRPTVVTLEGDIVRPGGAVTGGSDRSQQDHSMLARERELRELPAQMEEANARARQAAEKCQELHSRLEALQAQMGPLQERLAALARQERQQRAELDDLRRQLDRARQGEQWQAERRATLQQELDRLAAQIQETRQALAALSQEETEARQALEEAEAAVEAAGVGDLLRQLADVRAAAAAAQGDLQSQQALLANQRSGLQSVVDQIGAKERQIGLLQAEEEQLNRRIRELSAQEDQLTGALVALQSHIRPAEAELARLEAEQQQAEGEERRLQEGLRRDENAWNGAQYQLQRCEDALQQLRHDIEQDLGLVLLEESDEVAYQPPLPWEAVVEQLPALTSIPEGLEEEVREMRARLSRVSNVNPDAPREYEEAASRHEHLLTQSRDLEAAAADLRKIIRELDEVMRRRLQETFHAVAQEFVQFFRTLFNGGTAELLLTDPDDIANSGIEIIARPPGKRPQSLELLSGGERTLAACALIFAILKVSPTPFCVLDEVDAALDEANVDRFRQSVEALSAGTQFIIITHNRRTLEGTNAIYGITMGKDGISQVISLRLEGDRMVPAEENGSQAQAREVMEM
ncbi:chromosome segregation protein SMC [Litorilinea aerophila]|uniref:Chromosome partition protein Smc n=1 Tax=Litorilinea aerophila TaxID=1204385 RepID=A0A540VEA4_9CHLR|nr:chromosome segregation protein SMC [Litorilinea aerophila]MCC9077173.1 chromosome segregation protein SMC [Litorilinea aerophila]